MALHLQLTLTSHLDVVIILNLDIELYHGYLNTKLICNGLQITLNLLIVDHIIPLLKKSVFDFHTSVHLSPPCCRISQFRTTFLPMPVSLWNDQGDPVSDGVGLAGFKSRANAFLLA